MLRIRLTRTGKTRQESFRIVVAQHTNSVKGKYTELLGHYKPATLPKQFDIKKDRVEYWISKGAKPSDTVAALFKTHGFANMDQYISKRPGNLQRSKKKEAAEKADTKTATSGKKPTATTTEPAVATPAAEPSASQTPA